MRGTWPVLAVLGFGCQSGSRIEVHVSAPGAASVELFASLVAPDPQQLRPAEHGQSTPVVFWQRDRDPELDRVVLRSGDDDASFGFSLGDAPLEAFVAVGLTAEDRVMGIATRFVPTVVAPTGELHTYDVELQPAEGLPRLPGDVAMLPGQLVWGHSDDPKACVIVDNIQGTGLENYAQKSAVIGTEGDRDCDGYRDGDNVECDDSVHHYRDPVSIAGLSCAMSDKARTPSGDVDVCVAGAPGCVDGTGDELCQPSSFCLPKDVCTLCPTWPCDVLTVDDTVTYMNCPTPQPSGMYCSTMQLFVDLAALQIPGLQCDTTFAPLIADATHPPAPTIDYTATSRLSIDVLDHANCKFMLSGAGFGEVTSAVTGVVVMVRLSAPVAGRGLILPVRFAPDGAICDSGVATQCSVRPQPAETLDACVAAPVTPGTEPSLTP